MPEQSVIMNFDGNGVTIETIKRPFALADGRVFSGVFRFDCAEVDSRNIDVTASFRGDISDSSRFKNSNDTKKISESDRSYDLVIPMKLDDGFIVLDTKNRPFILSSGREFRGVFKVKCPPREHATGSIALELQASFERLASVSNTRPKSPFSDLEQRVTPPCHDFSSPQVSNLSRNEQLFPTPVDGRHVAFYDTYQTPIRPARRSQDSSRAPSVQGERRRTSLDVPSPIRSSQSPPSLMRGGPPRSGERRRASLDFPADLPAPTFPSRVRSDVAQRHEPDVRRSPPADTWRCGATRNVAASPAPACGGRGPGRAAKAGRTWTWRGGRELRPGAAAAAGDAEAHGLPQAAALART